MATSSFNKRDIFEEKHPSEEFFEPVSSISAAWRRRKEGEKKQIEYKKFCAETARNAVRLIETRDPKFNNIYDCYTYFTAHRKKIAEQHDSHRNYGIKRLPSKISYFFGETILNQDRIYDSQFAFLKDKILKFTSTNENDERLSCCIFNDEKGNITYDVQIYGYGLVFNTDRFDLIKIPYSQLIYFSATEKIKLNHVKSTDIRAALDYHNLLYLKIIEMYDMHEDENKTEINKNIEDLTDGLYNTMPLCLGSSSTTLMLASTLFQLHFIPPERNTSPISSDFKAFTSLPAFPDSELLKKYKIKPLEEKKSEIPLAKFIKLPRNEKIVCIGWNGGQYVLSQHPHVPFQFRFPNAWRLDEERLLLNTARKEGLDEYIKDYHANYYNKMESKLTAAVAGFLKNPECFYAVTRRYSETRLLDNWFIEFSINTQSITQLEEKVIHYQRSQKIFDQIDEMPYSVRELFTNTLNTEVLDISTEDLQNGSADCYVFRIKYDSFQGLGLLSERDCDFLELVIPDLLPKLLEMKIEEKDTNLSVLRRNTVPFLLKIAIEKGCKSETVDALQKRSVKAIYNEEKAGTSAERSKNLNNVLGIHLGQSFFSTKGTLQDASSIIKLISAYDENSADYNLPDYSL